MWVADSSVYRRAERIAIQLIGNPSDGRPNNGGTPPTRPKKATRNPADKAEDDRGGSSSPERFNKKLKGKGYGPDTAREAMVNELMGLDKDKRKKQLQSWLEENDSGKKKEISKEYKDKYDVS